MALSSVLYTVLSQMAVGMALILAVVARRAAWKKTERVADGENPSRAGWLIALILMLAALGTAGYGQGALAASWARFLEHGVEGLSPSSQVFLLFVLMTVLLVRREHAMAALAAAATGFVGVLLSAWAYRSAAYPDVSPWLVFLVYTLTTLALGTAYVLRLTAEAAQKPLRAFLAAVLVAGLLLHTAVPVFAGSDWLRSVSVVHATQPLLLWTGLVSAFAVPLGMLWQCRVLPDQLPWIMLFGMVMLRMLLFA